MIRYFGFMIDYVNLSPEKLRIRRINEEVRNSFLQTMHVVDILNDESWVKLSANSLGKTFCKSKYGLELSVGDLLTWRSIQGFLSCNIVHNIQMQWTSISALKLSLIHIFFHYVMSAMFPALPNTTSAIFKKRK